MADSGRWFKLWCSSVHDPDSDNLDIADFGRWAKLGAYIKEHGENGSIIITEPAKTVVTMLQLPSFNDVFECIKRFKNVTVSFETNEPVSIFIKYENWSKYQGDFSTERVRKHRSKSVRNETPKKRREEKRKEENINVKDEFEKIWARYPNKDGKKEAIKHFEVSVITKQDVLEINKALENYLIHLANPKNSWKSPKGGSTWFNNWRDWSNWQEGVKAALPDIELMALLSDKEHTEMPKMSAEARLLFHKLFEKTKMQWPEMHHKVCFENYNPFAKEVT